MQEWKASDFESRFGKIVNVQIVSYHAHTFTLDIETTNQMCYTFIARMDDDSALIYEPTSHHWEDHNGQIVELTKTRKPDWMWRCVVL